jgi:hypothetical protein
MGDIMKEQDDYIAVQVIDKSDTESTKNIENVTSSSRCSRKGLICADNARFTRSVVAPLSIVSVSASGNTWIHFT